LKTTIKKKKEMKEQNNNQPEQYAIQERISKHLREIEEQHRIKILYAVESGSRAWGFSSPDSDWDVRFIYVHEPEWYFHIEEQKDTIEQMFPDETDMSGWDLKKALRLFKSSNPSL
jgi:predicted nucleotidyltransferase